MSYMVYHHDNLDGLTAAYVAWEKLGHQGEYVKIGYEDVFPVEDVAGHDVMLLDYCPNDDAVLNGIADVANSVLVIAHVSSYAERLAEFATRDDAVVIFDATKAACTLAWDNFYPQTVTSTEPSSRVVADYVADRELWNFSLERSALVNAGIAAQVRTFKNWQKLSYMDRDAFVEAMAIEGEVVLRYQALLIDDILDRSCSRENILGHENVYVVNSSILISEIAAVLSPHEQFVYIWFETNDGRRRVELRSDRNSESAIDVGEMASMLGGGGKTNTAGFVVDPKKQKTTRKKKESAGQEEAPSPAVSEGASDNDPNTES